jgi:ribosome-binding protein aMBF1 (putative translation factor)
VFTVSNTESSGGAGVTYFGIIRKWVYDCRRLGGKVTKSIFTRKYERFRRLLVEARKTHGVTQVDLAGRLGRPQSFVSKYERGERRLDVVEFLEVARAIGIDAKEMIDTLAMD